MGANTLTTPYRVVAQIREDKQRGVSLNEISRRYGIAKSTASLYCRDLFSHPNRKYHTEAAARRVMLDRSHSDPSRDRGYRTKKCPTCEMMMKSTSQMCQSCRLILHRQASLASSLIRDASKKQRVARAIARLPRIFLDECPSSLGQGHHWILDNKNQGVCNSCGAAKQFSGGAPVLSW